MEYYEALAELKQFELDTTLKPYQLILEANGILYSMIKDIEEYGIKNGKNKKYKDSIDRVFELQSCFDEFNKINDLNYQLRTLLKNSMIERDLLIKENKELNQKIEAINKAFNQD